MMRYLQRLGKSLMLPVACLPVCSILMGIGYWIDPVGWGANSVIAAFLIKAGGAIIDNMAILFAIGVGVGMSKDNDGTGGLAALVSWLMMTVLLSTSVVSMLSGIPIEQVDPAFNKIGTQFTGILAGLIGAGCYNRFRNVQLPAVFSFFGGKRCVAIVTAGVSIVASLVLFLVWPVIYGALVTFGTWIMGAGAIGAGIYGFLNRLLIPFGLHHALNSVFWFNIAGIDDIGKFWGTIEGGVKGVTGMYQAGFFPVMMFGLPAGALAMYHTAKSHKKKVVFGLLAAAALSSFFTGVTEPLEFAFMFLAPALYVVHAILTGLCVGIVAMLPVRAGFNFSAGLVDWLLSFKAPMALNPLYLLGIGLVVGIIYYFVFRYVILLFQLKTPGREDEDDSKVEMKLNNNYTEIATTILEGLGGKENIVSIDYCVTRLRLEIKDYMLINEKKIKSANVAGMIRPGKNNVQIVIGTQVQFVAEELKRLWQ